MIALILAGIVAILVWYKFIRPLRYCSDMGVKQTSPWPIFGDEWKTTFGIRSFYENLQNIYKMYPNSRYTGFYRFTVPMLLIKDLDLIKQVTVKDFDHFTDHRPFPNSSKVASGNLFFLRGQKWRETRATLSGAFTSSKMKQIFHVMKETGENFTEYFLNKKEDNIEVEMKDTFTRFTNDVIASAAFGIKVDSLNQPENSFYLTGKELTDLSSLSTRLRGMLLLISPFLAKIFNFNSSRARVMEYFRDVIYEAIKMREEKGIVRQDMINLLLETRKGVKSDEKDEAIDTGFATAMESADIGKFKKLKKFSDDDIVSQAFVFFFAGFDTVSTAMCFGSYELALNKDIQDKLRKELTEVHKANNGELTYEALMSLKYLDKVVSEILRKWPPAAGIDRVATKPYTIQPTNKDEIPVHLNVGDAILLPMVPLHRDPAYFQNPEKFDPERFSDENKSSIRPGTYVPFGFGPRNCIGSRFALLEVKTLLYYLILNFEVTPTEKTRIPLKISPKSRITSMEGGLWLGLKRI